MSATATSQHLLKADDARQLGTKSVFKFEDLQQRCENYLETVRQQARQILQEAIDEGERQRSATEARGYADGFAAGEAAAQQAAEVRVQAAADEKCRQQLQTVLPALQTAVEQTRDLQLQLQKQAEEVLIRLSVAIAERLVRRVVCEQPEVSIELIRETLQMTGRTGHLELHVHPDDAAGLTVGAAAQAWQPASGQQQVQVIADESVSRGSCLVRTPQGMIDARWETQLDRITVELLGQL